MTSPKLLTVVFIDPTDDQEKILGEVSLNESGELALVNAPEEATDFLDSLVEQLNNLGSIRVKVPGNERYTVESREYTRTASNYLEGLRIYFQQYFSIELRSADDFTENADDFTPLSL